MIHIALGFLTIVLGLLYSATDFKRVKSYESSQGGLLVAALLIGFLSVVYGIFSL